jgi:hypothetical protein
MNTQSYQQRHAEAMLAPQGDDEATLVNLFRELTVLADRYQNDGFMVQAVENLASAIIVLLNGPLGRIDQSSLNKQVEDTVRRAGGNVDNL